MRRYGYHHKKIKKGILGDTSKIREELDELEDAQAESNRILMLCELADIVGALEAFMEKEFPDLDVYDLMTMAAATKRAFQIGERK